MPVGAPVLRLAGETPHYPIVLSFPAMREEETPDIVDIFACAFFLFLLFIVCLLFKLTRRE